MERTDDDDEMQIELGETKPLRSWSKPAAPAEFSLVTWASGAFTIVTLATAASILAFVSLQVSLTASADRNRQLSERCMLALEQATYDQACYVRFESVTDINTLFRNRWIHFMGESHSRDAFHTLKALQFGSGDAVLTPGDHSDQAYKSGSSLATFTWMPFLSDVVQADLPHDRGVFSRPDYVYIALGLHDILYRNDGLEPDTTRFVAKLGDLAARYRLVLVEMPHVIDRSRLSPAKADAAHFTNDRIADWVGRLSDQIRDSKMSVRVLWRFQDEPFPDQSDGIHSRTKAVRSTNRIVALVHWLEFPRASSPFRSAVFALALLGVAVCGLVIWIQIRAAFFSVCSADSVAAYCRTLPRVQSAITRIAFLSCSAMSQKVMTSCSVLFAVMAVVYLADGPNPVFSVSHKVRNNTLFAVLYGAILIVALLYRRRVPANLSGDKAVLNRLQTEEWKGMMQVAFIWYHLFDASSTYNLIRVFVASYVWMTGFGNLLFFQSKQDFSMLRLVKTIFRLNFLVILLCVVLDREWMLYYICPLHTVYYLFVWLVTRCPPSPTSTKGAICKVIVSMGLLLPFFNVPDVFESVFGIFGTMFLRNGSLYEWRFRAQLDAYSSSIGMLCACLLPSAIAFLDRSDQQKRLKIAVISGSVLLAWLVIFCPLPKSMYNTLHPYLGFLPIMAYLVLRNVFPLIRETYMPIFQFIGTITLETYLLQLHLYMSHDAKMVIMYLPENHLVNFVLSTSLYIAASYAVFKATANINDFLFPSTSWFEILFKRIAPITAALFTAVLLDGTIKYWFRHPYV